MVALTVVVRIGSHDGGYVPVLSELRDEGLLEKLVLLKGYDHVVPCITRLKMHVHRIDGLFMARKLPSWKKNARLF